LVARTNARENSFALAIGQESKQGLAIAELHVNVRCLPAIDDLLHGGGRTIR